MENQAFEKQNQVVNGLSIQFEENRFTISPQINTDYNLKIPPLSKQDNYKSIQKQRLELTTQTLIGQKTKTAAISHRFLQFG